MSIANKKDMTKDFVPVCYGPLFRKAQTQNYIEINSSKSFSKSNDKKLKLINDSRSIQKSIELHSQKRKIKPLKIRVNQKKSQEPNKYGVCSIKGFKAKISKITQDSVWQTGTKCNTQQTDISEHVQTTTFMTSQSLQSVKYHQLNHNSTLMSSVNKKDPFPTLGNSLVINEGLFNPDSLMQSAQNTLPSHQVSVYQSPTHHSFESQKLLGFQTPQKQSLKDRSTQLSTTQKTIKKEKLTLNMARRVETHETLKTQNDVCHSVVEQNEYKKFFDNIAFPDYFSLQKFNKQEFDKAQTKSNFRSYIDSSQNKQ